MLDEINPDEVKSFLANKYSNLEYISHEVEDASNYNVNGEKDPGAKTKIVTVKVKDKKTGEESEWDFGYDGSEWALWAN